MTDTVSPPTGPHLTPMFATGGQPSLSPTTEPHHAPIFDTGPHPDPLKLVGQEPEPAVVWSSGESASFESEVQAEPVFESALAVEPESEVASGPQIAPDPPQAFSALHNDDTDAFLRSVTGHMPAVVPAQPVVVPGAYQFVKRWKFALVVAGVWVLAAAAGLGFYFWWYTALSKTMPVFGILLFLVVCMVASMLVSLVPNRPQLSALAIALMAAPLASTAAAAVLHGAYYFEWITRPVIG